MTNSLQGRMMLGTAIVLATGMIVAGIAVYGFSRSALYREFDESLFSTVQAIAALTEENESGVEFEAGELGFEEFVRHERPSYYQLWQDGRILAKSQHLAINNLSSEAGTVASPGYSFTQLPDGRRGRQISVSFRPRFEYNSHAGNDDDESLDENSLVEQALGPLIATSPTKHVVAKKEAPLLDRQPPSAAVLGRDSGVLTLVWEKPDPSVTVVVARDTRGIDQPLETLRWVLAGVGTAVTTLSLGLLLVVVRSGLKPMKRVSDSIAEIDATSLQTRISSENVPTEVAPMVDRLNELLYRLEEAFHREQDFSKNIAHELRTPLAGLRSTLEVYLSRDHDRDEYQEGLAICLEICDQSEDLLENLLSLGRLEGNRLQPTNESFCLDKLFHECWGRVSEAAEAKRLQLRFDIAEDVEVCSDREMMRVVIRNLISNAVSHSDQQGQVEVRITSSPTKLQISNSGNRLSEAEAVHVFDRLWRGDDARTLTGDHFGLGLTLARRFAELLGYTLQASVDGDRFRVEVAA